MAAVLLVDDDDVARRIVRWMIERNGHTVTEAGDGGTAISMLEQGAQPDCIVLDLMMPNVGGVDVLRRMRDEPRWQHIPVVLMTALKDGREVEEARAIGFSRHFVKAYWHTGDLLQTIGHATGAPRAAEAVGAN